MLSYLDGFADGREAVGFRFFLGSGELSIGVWCSRPISRSMFGGINDGSGLGLRGLGGAGFLGMLVVGVPRPF